MSINEIKDLIINNTTLSLFLSISGIIFSSSILISNFIKIKETKVNFVSKEEDNFLFVKKLVSLAMMIDVKSSKDNIFIRKEMIELIFYYFRINDQKTRIQLILNSDITNKSYSDASELDIESISNSIAGVSLEEKTAASHRK